MESDQKKTKATYEPGELDRTRRNIGNINREEAEKMTKVLGGEIGYEKSPPIDMSAMPKKRGNGYIRNSSPQQEQGGQDVPANGFVVVSAADSTSSSYSSRGVLPEFSSKDRQQIDKLMMSLDYRIKPNYGIFNFILLWIHSDKVLSGFITVTLKNYVSYIKSLSADMSALLDCAPETYRHKVETDKDLPYRFCQMIENMPLRELSNLHESLCCHPQDITVQDLIPITRVIYRCVLPLSFLGEERIGELIKIIVGEMSMYSNVKVDRVRTLSENIFSQYKYVTKTIHKGMYPLLMRMCTNTYCPYPEFFSERISKILPFIDMTKYDLLLPEKMLRPVGTEEQVAEQTSASDNVTAETVSPHDTAVQNRPAELSRAHLIKLGLVMLNRMFPDAGWLRLQDMPDLFPYFQPLYQFEEGFNLLANDNPLQVMVVLLRILEDLFQGCRNIKFDVESNPIMQNAKDNLSDVLNSWSVYREELFDKRYAIKLKEYVNAVYSQKDFAKGQFGKKLMSDILWQTKYYFLPYFDFTQILLEKPANDSPYRALCLRTSFVREILTDIIEQSMKVADVHGLVAGVPDIWEPYRFGIPNVASRRLDVLLGAKRKSANANNMSLLKYTLGIVSVLDWWLNDKMSPAYQCAGKIPYRVSPDDGDPLFSVPVRNDQNKVFAHSIRAAAEKKKAEESKLETDKAAAGTQSQSEQQKKQEQ